MNRREKLLAGIVGTAVALVLGYNVVNTLFIERGREAAADLAALETQRSELEAILRSRESLARRWLNCVERTFSFEKTIAQGRLGTHVKEVARRHGFDDAVFATRTGIKIGRKTGISTVAQHITVQGRFEDATAFLRDIYRTPYLCQITKLSMSPLGHKGQRGSVKLELTVESPLLPEIKKAEIPHVRHASTMSNDPDRSLDPARRFLRNDAYFEILSTRNILRPYLPPPENVFILDNRDRKTVALKIDFFWDGRVYEQLVETVAGKTSLPVKGKGDVVEIVGTYADGTGFGPKRIQFDGKKQDWTYLVASHTPPLPPTVVDLALNNKHSEAVFLEIEITDKDNKKTSEPVMVFEHGVFDVRRYEDIQSVRVSGRYASGKRHPSRTFRPGDSRQTYEVPPEPAEQLAEIDESDPEIEVLDPPADPEFMVTGLLCYPGEDDDWTQEMIVTSSSERRAIRAGEVGVIDSGTLLAVIPALGGVVKITESGNYYIYPLGERLTQRVKLEARQDTDLPAAIDAWTRR